MKIFLLFLLLLAGAYAYFAHRIFDQPYELSINPQRIPGFTEALIGHTHDFNDSKSLPIVGVAAFDIDNDQIPELYISGGFYQQDALFKYQNGTFKNITQSAGLVKDFADTSYGAASIDVNRDGYSDLFIARDSGIYLYLNHAGHLTKTKLDIPLDELSTPISITLADINHDGNVDMFVSCYITQAKFMKYTYFNNKRYGASSLLLINNGDNTFSKVKTETSLDQQKNTLSAVFANLDNDLKIDLAVAYEAGQIRTFQNLGNNTFTEKTNPTSHYYSYPMGIAIGDYDNNGYMDIFAANIGSSIPKLLGRGDLKKNQILNRKWMLLKNNGSFSFEDTAEANQISDYELGRGAVLADINLDGLQDLIVETNFIHFMPHLIHKNPGKLLIQREDGGFVNTQAQSNVENKLFGSAPLAADFNNDGFPDIIHANVNGPVKAYISLGGGHHYSKVILDEQPNSIGAVVTLTTGTGKKKTDQFIVGEGFASDQSHQIIFGLGFETSIRQIEIRYGSGKKILLENPPIDQAIIARQHTQTSETSRNNPKDTAAKNPIFNDEWSEPNVRNNSPPSD